MSDCSPLRLTDNGNSPSQSSGDSQNAPIGQIGNRGHKTKSHQRRTNAAGPSGSGGDRPPRQAHHHRSREANDNIHSNNHIRSLSESSSTKSGQLKYGAKNVIELFIPVSLCMLIVVGTMKATDSYRYSSQSVIWYAQVMFTDQSVDTGTRVWQSLANALVMLVMIVVMTTVLILLYKFRCYKTIHGWLILSSLMLLFIFAIIYVAEILKVYNVPLDIYTLMIFIWNFGVVGMICIHWKGPLLLQQGYLIMISALLALVFIRSLPDWTTWTVLGIVSVWDLVAVLCPRGPLRILVETAQERGEAIFPALIYSSTMMWEVATMAIVTTNLTVTMADNNPRPSGSRSTSSSNRRGERSRHSEPRISSSRAPPSNKPDLRTPIKRSQHPVEIHYDGVAQTPEVDIIQPSLRGRSADWNDAPVRTLNSAGNNRPAREVNRQRPSGRVLYDSTPVDTTVNFRPQDEQIEQHVQVVEEERGVKLGLGDFIFFSLLVGKASSYGDWTITLSCYVAILVGLCLTLSLLAVFRKALPALPISIAFGLSAFFMSYMFAVPLAEQLSVNQVFI